MSEETVKTPESSNFIEDIIQMCIRDRARGMLAVPSFISTSGRESRRGIHPCQNRKNTIRSVSYTHLDVYKRQVLSSIGLALFVLMLVLAFSGFFISHEIFDDSYRLFRSLL